MSLHEMVSVEVAIPLEDLADQLVRNVGTYSSVSYDELSDFFAAIDQQLADWHFTKMCAKYFNDELKKMAEEE